MDANDVRRKLGVDALRGRIDAGIAKNRAARKTAAPNGAGSQSKPDWRLNAVTFKAIHSKRFNPISFAVPGLVPSEGVTLISSKPKVGKSWLILDLCLGATMDRFVLGDIKPVQGDVLLLALEDSERRLQNRGTKLLPTFTGEWPERLVAATQWRRVDQGGLDDLREWIEDVRKAGRKVAFIAIDVLKMIRPLNKGGKLSAYDADYEAITGLHKLAIETGVPIIIAHHTRKADADDLIDKVSGTFGLVGAVDTVIVIERTAQRAIFDVRGRDIEEAELAVEFNKDTCRWTILGAAAEVHRSDTRTKILAALAGSAVTLSPKTVTQVTGLSHSNVRQTLHRMVENGEIQSFPGGKYGLATSPHTSPVTASQSHSH
jgi:hypothetical protein